MDHKQFAEIMARWNASPNLDPQVSMSNAVYLNNEFSLPSAVAAKVFIEHAKLDILALVEEVERLQAGILLRCPICERLFSPAEVTVSGDEFWCETCHQSIDFYQAVVAAIK